MAEDREMLRDQDNDMEMAAVPDEDSEDDEDDMEDETTIAPESNNEQDAAIDRRRAIQAIMRDTTISAQDKAHQIQTLMSGGRTAVAPPPAPVIPVEPNAACVHYERNCNIVAPCCNRVFGCRICHDEASAAGHPPLDRFTIREVVCKNCNTRQNASNQCVECQTVFGEYHCGTCNLWMSMVCVCLERFVVACLTLDRQAKKPFHCDQCGFCRVGGVESFRHCSECCMCISVSVYTSQYVVFGSMDR